MSFRSFQSNAPSHIPGNKGLTIGIKRPYMSLRAPTLDPLQKENINNSSNPPTIKEYGPVVDREMPVVVSFGCSSQVSRDVLPIISLPSLPPISDHSFELILGEKLELCSTIFDFADKSQKEQKEEKSKYLNELIVLFSNSREAKKLNPVFQRAIFRMLETNIFRPDPKFPSQIETYEYAVPVVEPSWPHLIFCYQLLILFVQLFPEAEYVNFNVMKRAMFLMQLPDANERNQLVIFLKYYFDNHPNEQLKIISEIKNALITMKEGLLTPFCMMPLLLIFSHIIQRYYEEYAGNVRSTFFEAVIPLIGYRYIAIQYQHVKNTFILAIKADPSIIYHTLKKIQALWPYQNGNKQVLFTDLLINVCVTIDQKVFERFSQTFFAFLNELLYSDQYRVLDLVTNLFMCEEYQIWISKNSVIAIDKLFEPIYNLSLNHYDDILRTKCTNVLQMMLNMNSTEYHKKRLILKRKEKLGILNVREVKDTHNIESWRLIANSAKQNGLKDNCVNEFIKKYKDKVQISRFLPSSFKTKEVVTTMKAQSFNLGTPFQRNTSLTASGLSAIQPKKPNSSFILPKHVSSYLTKT